MVKVNLGGCSSFVTDAEYKEYVEKAYAALEVLENETGKGNDFLGWKHLPSQTLAGTSSCAPSRMPLKSISFFSSNIFNHLNLLLQPDSCPAELCS